MVGMVVTISPSLSLYRIVVLPAASRPTMRIPVEERSEKVSVVCTMAKRRRKKKRKRRSRETASDPGTETEGHTPLRPLVRWAANTPPSSSFSSLDPTSRSTSRASVSAINSGRFLHQIYSLCKLVFKLMYRHRKIHTLKYDCSQSRSNPFVLLKGCTSSI